MRPIKYSRLFAVGAPLFLGACGMPVAVQVVSFLADGLSFLATDKSISDHGLSALTNQDCALWRGLKGEAVCRDTDTAPVVLADRKLANRGESKTPIEARQGPEIAEATGDFDDEWTAVDDTAATPPPTVPATVPAKSWIVAVDIAETLDAPIAPASRRQPAKSGDAAPNRQSRHPQGRPPGGYYYIIASYFRPADAERFAERHPAFAPVVVVGAAKGRQVYRVAVGPLAKDKRPITHAKLTDAGIDDAWGLSLKSPEIITELAALVE